MNKNISALFEIAQKETRKIMGLMSGTSLDGLDLALCKISGEGDNTVVKIEQFETVDYSDDIKTEIHKTAAENGLDQNSLTGGLSEEVTKVKERAKPIVCVHGPS